MNNRDAELVSVIIPNYNYARYLPETIGSVLNQTYSNIEIIVVDDGSTDNSLEVLYQLSDKNKLVVIESINRGSCTARNLGMSRATGQFIAFLDADDTWDADKVERQIKHLKESKADLVFCQMREYGEGSTSNSSFKDFVVEHKWFLQNPGSTPFSPSAVILTRDLASRVGGWNTSLTGPAEDFDYFRRCAKFGVIRSSNEVLVSHRQHPDSLTAASTRRYFEDNRRVLRIMFAEDRPKLRLVSRFKLWFKFHLSFFKHAFKDRNLSLVLLVSKSFFQF